MAESLGDRAWSAVIGVHRTIAEDVVDANRGRLVKSTGDGILAVFPDPASAMEGAVELRAKLREMGITLRVGLHSGRIEVADDNDVSGVAVHLAARVMAVAGDGEIVVSRTVRDLMLGSEYGFRDLGPRVLKGVDGAWELYASSPWTGSSLLLAFHREGFGFDVDGIGPTPVHEQLPPVAAMALADRVVLPLITDFATASRARIVPRQRYARDQDPSLRRPCNDSLREDRP